MTAAIVIPAITGWRVHVKSFPPLHAAWDPRVGVGTVPAVALAVVAVAFSARAATRWRWRTVVWASFAASSAWLFSLATVDGWAGIGHILDTSYEYLNTARGVTNISATLHEYISRIPLDSAHHWPVHIAGHPAGALVFFVLLVHLGLGSGLAAGVVVALVAATTPAAVLITLRTLGAENGARVAAPFLVFGSAAVWMAVSADAVFATFAAWGLCALARAAKSPGLRSRIAWSIVAGLVLGYCVMMSYGLPLLVVLACAILIIAKTWRPLPWAVGAALFVVLSFAAGGFVWWNAYPVLVQRYWAGIAHRRPLAYWIWGDLAALCFSAGPIVGASVATTLGRLRRFGAAAVTERPIIVLVLAALLSVVLADVSQMSKAEVERIWLPFVPWLLVGTALLPQKWRRFGLSSQVVFALLVQHLLFTGW